MEPAESKMFTIEWGMMDTRRFFTFSIGNSLALRSLLYPLTVIKTRLQVQRHNTIYKGTFDAFVKIIRLEGFCGLYKGYLVNTVQVVSGIGYLITYEKVRDLLTKYANISDSRVKGLIGGGCGSIVGQTIITPFDVVSQHVMVSSGKRSFVRLDNPLEIQQADLKKGGLTYAIIKELWKRDGFRGFYRGYFASLNSYVPSSALWWMFYPMYSEFVHSLVPVSTSHMLVCCSAGTLSGMTVAILTNPLDVIRANIQVLRIDSYSVAMKRLWSEEHFNLFRKGLSARVTQSCITSAVVVAGYETLKRWSVKDEYKDKIRW